jgi:hypothetical protein
MAKELAAKGRGRSVALVPPREQSLDVTDDFQKLQLQYFDATPEERERLWPNLMAAIRKLFPGFLEEYEQAFRNGDQLIAMFRQCQERALARPELSEGRKTNAQEDAAAFFWVLNELKQVDPAARELAIELATRVLFTALRAGLGPAEVDELRERLRTEHQQKAGARSGERRRDKPWREYAKTAALRMHNANRALTLTDIAEKIEKEWESEKFEKVGRQRLFKYLSDLVDNGELPASMKRPARNGRHG